MFTFDLVDVDALAKEFDGTMIHVHAACRKAVEKGLDAGNRVARDEHRYKDQTGTLTKSIRPVFRPRRGELTEGELIAEAPYASFVENGTRPHDIWPKAGHGSKGPLQPGQSRRAITDIGTHRIALRWYGADGQPVFRRMVHHPGTQPSPFFGPAYLKMERVIIKVIEEAVSNAQRFFDV